MLPFKSKHSRLPPHPLWGERGCLHADWYQEARPYPARPDWWSVWIKNELYTHHASYDSCAAPPPPRLKPFHLHSMHSGNSIVHHIVLHCLPTPRKYQWGTCDKTSYIKLGLLFLCDSDKREKKKSLRSVLVISMKKHWDVGGKMYIWNLSLESRLAAILFRRRVWPLVSFSPSALPYHHEWQTGRSAGVTLLTVSILFFLFPALKTWWGIALYAPKVSR